MKSDIAGLKHESANIFGLWKRESAYKELFFFFFFFFFPGNSGNDLLLSCCNFFKSHLNI